MVSLSEIIICCYPLANFSFGGNIQIVDNGAKARITKWDESVLGPEPQWDDVTQTYPALEAFRRQAEAEQATKNRLILYPSAESYQVRAWMIRGGLDPDLVPQIIAQVVPDGPQRKEALMRWDYAVRIPRDFPLVNVIGAQMGLTPEQIDAAWPEILTL